MRNSVDFCIMLCASEHLRVFFDRIYPFPAITLGKRDCVSTNASKAIDNYSLDSWRRLRNVLSNASALSLRMRATSLVLSSSPCYRLRCHTKPSVFSHPNSLVVLGKNAKSLMKVSRSVLASTSDVFIQLFVSLLYVPRYLS